MSHQQTEIDKISEAITKLQSGERVVQVAHDGHVIKYAEVELNDLIKLRDKMLRKIQSKKRQLNIVTSKNL